MIDEKALEAALNAVVPGGGPVWDYFDGCNITAADAEEIGVKLAIPGRWHWHSEVRGDEFRDTLKTVLGSAITAYLQALSTGSTGEAEGCGPISDEPLEALSHARTTAANDDMSKPGTVERKRHCQRMAAMQSATAEIVKLRAMLSAAGER